MTESTKDSVVVDFYTAALTYAPTRKLCRIFARMTYEDGEYVQSWHWLFIGEYFND